LGAGWPDLFLARRRDGRLLAVECKSAAGRVSPRQAEVIETLRGSGLDVRIVRPSDVDELLEVLR
jgi:VRR-NUC domain